MNWKAFVGVDIGNRNDRFTIVTGTRNETGSTVRNARARRGVSSDEVAAAVIRTVLDLHEQLPPGVKIEVAIDRTGLGWGPTEAIEKGLRELRRDGTLADRQVRVAGVAIVAGDSENRDEEETWKHNVGRDRLVGRALMALRTGGLDVTNISGDAAGLLREELQNLVENATKAGRTRVDHKPGKHDDVFMALCIGYWFANLSGLGGYTIGRSAAPTDLHLPGLKTGRRRLRRKGASVSVPGPIAAAYADHDAAMREESTLPRNAAPAVVQRTRPPSFGKRRLR
jgi:hypothetical protein